MKAKSTLLDPFGGAPSVWATRHEPFGSELKAELLVDMSRVEGNPRLLRRGKEALLRVNFEQIWVNPEPLGLLSTMNSGRIELGSKAIPGLQTGESKG